MKLSSAPLFRGLAAADFAAVMSLARQQECEPRQTIFRERDPVRFIKVIASGRVKITQVSATGKEVILRVEGAGAVVGDPGLTSGSGYPVTARTIEACILYKWHLREFDALARRFPTLCRNGRQILVDRLRALEERFRDLATVAVPERLARLLLRLHEQGASVAQAAHIALSCEDLADMSGTTLFTVSRVLSEWEERDIIQRAHRAIVVQDFDALAGLAT